MVNRTPEWGGGGEAFRLLECFRRRVLTESSAGGGAIQESGVPLPELVLCHKTDYISGKQDVLVTRSMANMRGGEGQQNVEPW